MHENESNERRGVCAGDRKSPRGHVVCSPSSDQLEVDLSRCHVTDSTGNDDVVAGQPISVRCDETTSQESKGVLKYSAG